MEPPGPPVGQVVAAGEQTGWVARLFPTDGHTEREQRLAVLLEAEFAGGSPLMSAQFRSRILTLASPTAEEAERRDLIASVLATLQANCPPRPEPSEVLLATAAIDAVSWFRGRLPRGIGEGGFLSLPVLPPSPAEKLSAREFYTARTQSRINETPSLPAAQDRAFMFDSLSRAWMILEKAANGDVDAPVFGGLTYGCADDADAGMIMVQSLTGRRTVLHASPHDTVYSVKEKVEELEGIPTSQQRLCHRQRQLDDSLTLEECRIQLVEQRPASDDDWPNDARLVLVLRLRGGCCSLYYQREVVPAPNTRVLPASEPVRVRLSLARASGNPGMAGKTWGGEADVTREYSDALYRSYEVAVVQVRQTVCARVLYPAPRVLRWDRDELRGFFLVMSRHAPELVANEDLRWQLLVFLALPVAEWEAEVPGSRRTATRTREPRVCVLDIRDSDITPNDDIDSLPEDVCFSVNPPAGGWDPDAHYRVEMCVANESLDALSDFQKLYTTGSKNPPGKRESNCTFHSYSFYVSPESGDVEMPTYATTGGLLEYFY